MSLSKKQIEFTHKVGVLIVAAYEMGYELTLGHVWRDTETQKRYVAQGLSETMNSKHLDRLAVDLNLFIDGQYMKDGAAYRTLGELWEKLGGRWGGRFKIPVQDYDTRIGVDANHFEWKE